MADDAQANPPAKTPAQIRAEAIKAYLNAETQPARDAIVEANPFLATVFSAGNRLPAKPAEPAAK